MIQFKDIKNLTIYELHTFGNVIENMLIGLRLYTINNYMKLFLWIALVFLIGKTCSAQIFPYAMFRSEITFIDSSTYIATSSATTHTWTQTVAGNYLVVGMVFPGDRRTDSVQVWTGAGIKYNLTKLWGNNFQPVIQAFGTSFWGLKNPPIGIDTIKTWNLSQAGQGAGFSASYAHVNEITPTGPADSAQGDTGTVIDTVTATSTDDLVIAMLGTNLSPDPQIFTPVTTGLIKRIEVRSPYDTYGNHPAVALLEIHGINGDVIFSGTISTAQTWKIGGVALKFKP